MLGALLRGNVYCRIAIHGIENRRRVKAFRIGRRKPSVPTPTPLHRRPYSVAISQVNVVSHADLVSVINDGSTGQRKQHAIHQFDAPPVVVEQGSQSPPYAEI